MALLIGALTIGLILSLLALGVFITFRIFHFPDITADGSITFGAALCAVLLVKGVDPFWATAAAFAGGVLAGTITGILNTYFKIQALLAGILVMTALYSVNLHVMGKSNVPLLSESTMGTYAERAGALVLGSTGDINLGGWLVSMRDISILLMAFAIVVLIGLALYLFFRTNLGTAMRATGDNAQMIRALGADVESMTVLSGALLAQYQGFADVQMGIGMVVWGLASVIIGEALVGPGSLGLAFTGAVMGSVLFRLLVAIALRWGLDPNDLKLITAAFVFVALILPRILTKFEKKPSALKPVAGAQPESVLNA
jgi:putative tryptophan/tyrosine transport system permease protein